MASSRKDVPQDVSSKIASFGSKSGSKPAAASPLMVPKKSPILANQVQKEPVFALPTITPLKHSPVMMRVVSGDKTATFSSDSRHGSLSGTTLRHNSHGPQLFTRSGRGVMKHVGKTDKEIEEAKQCNIAYEYLCHLEEARSWLEACLPNEEFPAASDMEQGLRNGVFLVKLGSFLAPDVVLEKHFYDGSQSVYKEKGLSFRHTDNISQWLRALVYINFPAIFYPVTTDIYEKKNMPRVVYCLHALSQYAHFRGK